MAQMPFGTDPSELKFNLNHDDDQTRIRVDGTNYTRGTVTFDSSAASSIPLKIGNGSPTKWKLTDVSVTLNPTSSSPISVPMKKQDDETWKGTLLKNDVTGLVNGTLHVKAQWEERSSGKKEPREDPVIIVNPKPTP